ncbi:MAG: hypothetical protein II119_02130, partial [Bacilli bacterium]|nr:hypothetical protein [Bacilli bacterium]
MKIKFKKFFKKCKRIISKIVADKQLLTIFSLMLLVIIIGCIVIGFLRTFAIIGSLILIAFVIRFITKKSKKEVKKEKKKIKEKEKVINDDVKDENTMKEDSENELLESSDDSIMLKEKKK